MTFVENKEIDCESVRTEEMSGSEEEVSLSSGQVQINRGRWTKREKRVFEEGFNKFGKEWRLIAGLIQTRTVIQIRTHAQKYFQKLAKKTGGPVMSTSKKEKLPNAFVPPTVYPDDAQEVEEYAEYVSPNKMSLRKRANQDIVPKYQDDQDIDDFKAHASRYKKRRLRESANDSITGSASEGSDSGSESFKDDLITQELEFYNNQGDNAEQNLNIRIVSGRVTPGMLAAATLLMAPRHTEKMCKKRLHWAKTFVAQQIY